MRVIDSHFHWYPRSIYERLADQSGYPRAVRVQDGFSYWYAEDEMGGNRGRIWLDLEGGFAASDAASGVETTVINTTGTFSGLLDQLPRGVLHRNAEHVFNLPKPIAAATAPVAMPEPVWAPSL